MGESVRGGRVKTDSEEMIDALTRQRDEARYQLKLVRKQAANLERELQEVQRILRETQEHLDWKTQNT